MDPSIGTVRDKHADKADKHVGQVDKHAGQGGHLEFTSAAQLDGARRFWFVA